MSHPFEKCHMPVEKCLSPFQKGHISRRSVTSRAIHVTSALRKVGATFPLRRVTPQLRNVTFPLNQTQASASPLPPLLILPSPCHPSSLVSYRGHSIAQPDQSGPILVSPVPGQASPEGAWAQRGQPRARARPSEATTILARSTLCVCTLA